MVTPRKWTLENLIVEASKYTTLKDFRTKSEGAYKAYLSQGKPEKILSAFEYARGYWTEESALKEAQKYESRWEFQQGSGGAYRFLWKLDLLGSVFEPLDKSSWCEKSVEKVAKGLPDRKTLRSKFPGAYGYAVRNNMLDSLFGPTLNTPSCDNDVVYLWRPKGYKNTYKVGVTSKRLGHERINYVSRKSSLEVDEVIFIETDDARSLEGKILSENSEYGFFPSFSGSTEFRTIKDPYAYLVGK